MYGTLQALGTRHDFGVSMVGFRVFLQVRGEHCTEKQTGLICSLITPDYHNVTGVNFGSAREALCLIS